MEHRAELPSPDCRVCGASLHFLIRVDGRDYWRCTHCQATLLAAEQLPSRDEEIRHYQLHENDTGDAGYRHFLSKLAEPLLARLEPGRLGLDFGCGPGPALAHMLTEAGHKVAVYDPFFYPDTQPLGRYYDFVTCTEVVEHLHHPQTVFSQLRDLIKPGGWLAVMTCFQDDDSRFAQWHYRRDPTHVVFYREHSFRYLAREWGWHCEVPCKDVVLLRKPG